MAEITAAMVKELRERAGAGMMDCKKALAETNGDLEGAIDWLRAKGLSAAAKKAGRTAAEGLVGVTVDGNRGAIVEVNSETDFVAKNELFQEFVTNVAKLALQHGSDVETLAAADYPGGGTVQEKLTDNIAKIGENQSLRRAAVLQVTEGAVISYVHNQVAPGLGKIGVLVALESSAPADTLNALGKQIAMHVAAANPRYLDMASVDAKDLARERDVLREQAKASGKADAIIDKMVEGRLKKFYEDTVLLEQIYVVDGESRVSKIIESTAKDSGAPVKLAGFARFALGEGIEKEATDFAAEVAAVAKR